MSLTYHEYKKDEKIAVDIETKDPNLLDKGPGVYRKDGYIVGVSFANRNIAEYYPLKHPDTTGEEREKNLKYIAAQLIKPNSKIFANSLYDMDWLKNFQNLEINGIIEDIQIAEPLLDEYRHSYSLNSLSNDYLGASKNDEEMLDYCLRMGWEITKKTPPVHYLWKMDYAQVKKYAADDARFTYDIFEKQFQELKKQNLLKVYDIECRLIPLLLLMRKTGVRIDLERMKKTEEELLKEENKLQSELNRLADFELNVNSNNDLEKFFKRFGLPITYNELTAKMKKDGKKQGNPKFDKQTLSNSLSAIPKKILILRHIKTLQSLFIEPYKVFLVNDRIHGQFNPLRSDSSGTVTGRLSMSNPNLQQVSGKNEEHDGNEFLSGAVIRKLFIPESGCRWLKIDWSQIEYRLIAHYALGEGSEDIRARYNDNPETDYHDELGKMTGISERKVVKTLNFGAAYGMGPPGMSKNYGWDLNEAKQVYAMYHSKVPFIKETSNRVGRKASRIGFVKTLLSRRERIPDSDKLYIMFNRLIQGAASDVMKKSMVDAYEKGLFNVLYPHITVHDELDCSMPNTPEGFEAGEELKYTMEHCFDLRVPILADVEIGDNWGGL